MIRRWRRGPALLLLLASFAVADDDGYERGYRDGYERGYEAGRQAARKDHLRDERSGYSGGYSGAYRLPSGIVVVNASYGEGRRRCALTAWAVQQFNRRTSASVAVSNSLCGDPSPGKRKSLDVEYLCSGEVRSASAYEHRTLSINCY